MDSILDLVCALTYFTKNDLKGLVGGGGGSVTDVARGFNAMILGGILPEDPTMSPEAVQLAAKEFLADVRVYTDKLRPDEKWFDEKDYPIDGLKNSYDFGVLIVKVIKAANDPHFYLHKPIKGFPKIIYKKLVDERKFEFSEAVPIAEQKRLTEEVFESHTNVKCVSFENSIITVTSWESNKCDQALDASLTEIFKTISVQKYEKIGINVKDNPGGTPKYVNLITSALFGIDVDPEYAGGKYHYPRVWTGTVEVWFNESSGSSSLILLDAAFVASKKQDIKFYGISGHDLATHGPVPIAHDKFYVTMPATADMVAVRAQSGRRGDQKYVGLKGGIPELKPASYQPFQHEL